MHTQYAAVYDITIKINFFIVIYLPNNPDRPKACCDGELLSIPMPDDGSMDCCGRRLYNTSERECCNDQVLDIGLGCCLGK